MTLSLKLSDSTPSLDLTFTGIALLLSSVWGVLLLLFAADVRTAVAIWNGNGAYSYCFLVPLISLFLLYARRGDMHKLDLAPSWSGAGLFFGCILVWAAGQAAAIVEIRQFAVVGLLQASFIALLGWRAYRHCLFPMLYLFLMVPTATQLLDPMQNLTAILSGGLLRLSGIVVLVDHHLIAVPHGLYEVAPGCAGLNFLLSSVALSSLYAMVVFQGWIKRVSCVVIAMTLSIATNALRVFGIIWLAEATNRRIDIVTDHRLYGWIVYVAAMLSAMVLAYRLREMPPTSENPESWRRLPPPPWSKILPTACVLLLFAASAQRTDAIAGPLDLGRGRIQFELPRATLEERSGAPQNDFLPQPLLNADKIVRADYALLGGQRIDALVAYYWRQREGRKIGDLATNLTAGSDWLVQDESSHDVRLGVTPVTIKAIHISRANRRKLVWTINWIGGRYTADLLVARLYGMAAAFGGDGRSATIVLSADDDDGKADHLLADFCAESHWLETALANATLQSQ